MSNTYSIACVKCRQHLWIAQIEEAKIRIYDTVAHVESLGTFFQVHKGHPLVFDDNVQTVICEYEEVNEGGLGAL